MKILLQNILSINIALSIVFLISACGSETEIEPEAVNAEVLDSNSIPVTIASAVQQEVIVKLHSVGLMVSRNTPTLAAEVDARVTEILTDVGKTITIGQSVVKLDTTRLELLRKEGRASVERINANIKNARSSLKRYQDLKKRNVTSQEKLDDAIEKLAVEQASLAAAKARLAIVEDQLSKTEIRSPMDGMVKLRHVSVGDYVKDGDDLLSIVDNHHLRARLPFPETVAYRLELGQTVIMGTPVAPEQVIEAHISQLKPEVGLRNRAVTAIIDFENPGTWRPDATAVASVIVARRPLAIVIPAQAVVTRLSGQVVYLYGNDKVTEHSVETGERLNGDVEIVKGLNAGDVIVVEGASFLTDGATVTVQEQGN